MNEFFFILFFFPFLISCSLSIIESSFNLYRQKNFQQAADAIPDKEIKGNNEILFLLHKANLLQYSGKYEESNKYFLLANKKFDELIDIEIIDNIKSSILNDYFKKYSGEYFERIYSNLFCALNFLMLNKYDEAFVEIKRAKNKIEKYEIESNLFHFIYALTSDLANEPNDAIIEYKKLLEKNINDSFIIERLMYNATQIGDKETIEEIKEKYNNFIDNNKAGKYLIFFLFNGIGPIKTENFVIIDNVKVSIPVYKENYNLIKQAEISIVKDDEILKTKKEEKLDDVYKLAKISLDKRIAKITAKEALRSYLKNQIKNRLEEKNKIINDLLYLAISATEFADLRCWSTLPAYISFISFKIDNGEINDYNILINYLTENNIYIEKKKIEQIKKDKYFNIYLIVQ